MVRKLDTSSVEAYCTFGRSGMPKRAGRYYKYHPPLVGNYMGKCEWGEAYLLQRGVVRARFERCQMSNTDIRQPLPRRRLFTEQSSAKLSFSRRPADHPLLHRASEGSRTPDREMIC
jgi:hypothetical protein